jgi:hypothetical protein
MHFVMRIEAAWEGEHCILRCNDGFLELHTGNRAGGSGFAASK